MYPLKATAAQVLGFAGTENTGLAGMEMFYDKELSGKAGSETIVRDPAGHTLKTIAQQEPLSGQDVRLTLDSDIQYYAEDVLKKTVRDTGGQVRHRHRDGPAHRRGPGHGQCDARGVPWLRQGSGGRQEPRRGGLLRAWLDLQARHDLGRSGGRHGEAGHTVQRAVQHPRRRPRGPRLASPRGRELLGARDHPVVEQRRRGQDRPEHGRRRACTSGSRPTDSASRPASSSRSSPAASSLRSTSGRDPPSATSPWGRASR